MYTPNADKFYPNYSIYNTPKYLNLIHSKENLVILSILLINPSVQQYLSNVLFRNVQ